MTFSLLKWQGCADMKPLAGLLGPPMLLRLPGNGLKNLMGLLKGAEKNKLLLAVDKEDSLSTL